MEVEKRPRQRRSRARAAVAVLLALGAAPLMALAPACTSEDTGGSSPCQPQQVKADAGKDGASSDAAADAAAPDAAKSTLPPCPASNGTSGEHGW